MKETYDLLKSRYILDIFIGDTNFGDIVSPNDVNKNIKCSLPYLTGSAICDIANRFGFALSYKYGGALSRWAYMERILDWCIENNRISDLLKYLFSKERFVDVLRGYSVEDVDFFIQSNNFNYCI